MRTFAVEAMLTDLASEGPHTATHFRQVLWKSELPQAWSKLLIVSKFLAAVLVPLSAVLVGNRYSQSITEREVQAHFVELAVGILREQPRGDATATIGSWVVGIMSRYSGVRLRHTGLFHWDADLMVGFDIAMRSMNHANRQALEVIKIPRWRRDLWRRGEDSSRS